MNPVDTSAATGIALGVSLAVVCSWQRNRSILWGIFHGMCGWFYVIYFAVTRRSDEVK
jgi:uncharacterized membrane protein YjjB (DUF3815 family)